MEDKSLWKWLVGAVVAAATAVGTWAWWGTTEQPAEVVITKDPNPEMGAGIGGNDPPSYDPTTRKYNYEK